MNIIRFKCGPILACSYLLFNDGAKEGILIDAGGDIDKILGIANENGVKISSVLLTHGHFDHVGACYGLQKLGAKIFIHKNDEKLVTTDEGECGFHIKVDKFTPDVLLSDGDEFLLCGIKVKVIHTPGHTAGGVCYLIENNIFSGDTLFLGSYGRVDLGGDIVELKNSIMNSLFTLSGDFTVYPGHERPTTLSRERELNPIRYA